ncbi:SPAG1 [Mytilus coruscus]|uniref:SPAG1 n=1 Tax=Mytilus coruscus TaxID=42192 RepID=A0A6J8BHG7_MYTCO|nr:SPAG1 [Mytilus coruscus]
MEVLPEANECVNANKGGIVGEKGSGLQIEYKRINDPKLLNSFGLQKRGLKIANLNIQHILPKIEEIRLKLNEKKSLHILGLCETFLNPELETQHIVDAFNKHFINIAPKDSLSTSQSYKFDSNKIYEEVAAKVPQDTWFYIPLITVAEVKDCLSNLNVAKATGIDQISPHILKLSSEELNSLKKQMGKPAENKPRKRIVIEETDSDSEEEGSKDQPKVSKSPSTSTKIDTKIDKQSDTQGSSSKQKQKRPLETKSQETKTDSEKFKEKQKEKKSTQPSSEIKSSTIKPTSFGLPQSIPKLEKATPYEFITTWNSLKQSTDLQPYADLLRQIPPKDLPKVISNKLDGGMLSKIAKCVAEKFTGEDDLSTSYQILMNVSKVPRFDTIAMFMSKEEKKDIETVLKKVESSGDMARKEDIIFCLCSFGYTQCVDPNVTQSIPEKGLSQKLAINATRAIYTLFHLERKEDSKEALKNQKDTNTTMVN